MSYVTRTHPSWCTFDVGHGCVMQMRTDLFGFASNEEVRAVAEITPWAGPADLEKARMISMTVHAEARSLYYAKPAGRA